MSSFVSNFFIIIYLGYTNTVALVSLISRTFLQLLQVCTVLCPDTTALLIMKKFHITARQTPLQNFNNIMPQNIEYFFPKGTLRNVLARLRLRSQYLKDIKYPEALDFEWGFPNDTGYVLRIQAMTLRLEIPKNWWIHQQSPSILGYHKHFFTPSYLQTIRTTYSYERRRRHYYNNGIYVKKPKTQYLNQRVDEVKQTLTSWPLPRHHNNKPSLQNKPSQILFTTLW